MESNLPQRIFGDRRKSRQTLLGSLVVLMLLFGAYEYITSSRLKAELAGVQKQVNTLGSASPTLASTSSTVEAVVAKASPAVVSIVITKSVPQYDVTYEGLFGTREVETGAGSGFFVRSDGYIVTNSHVVSDESATYTVVLGASQKKVAKVLYRDIGADIAVLKIDGTNYPTVTLGDSSALALGQSVIAIGNALGEYTNTISTGIISGLNRSIDASDQEGRDENLTGVIQTDAAVNLGNSGGPLLDLSGRVIGVNVATIVGSSNIAFAVPIDTVQAILNKVL